MMLKKTLIIYGSLGAPDLVHHVGDWSRAVVLEMDAPIPPEMIDRGASVIPSAPLVDHHRGMDIERRVHAIFNELLAERVGRAGLETGREFRAACLNIETYMRLSPYLYNLDIARRLAAEGPWEKIVVSPGSGVSLPAWRQLADFCAAPLVVLSDKAVKLPFWWMLKRRLEKKIAWFRRKSATKPKSLPVADEHSLWLCGDSKLAGLLAEDGNHWAAVPAWKPADEKTLHALRAGYQAWWEDWWNDWLADHPSEDKLSPGWIINQLGRHLCQNVYPLHAIFLRQAREVFKSWSPRLLVISTMLGRPEIMWQVAARERGIPTAAYTLDDPVNPEFAFRSDFVFCDDARQHELALKRGIAPGRILAIRSHRALVPTEKHQRLKPGQRARIILADTFFSGWNMGHLPSLSFWVYQLVVETARLMPEHDFVIKFHPIRERPTEELSWGGFHYQHHWLRLQQIQALQPPANLSLAAPESLMPRMLNEAHVLLNIGSYAGCEACALNVPVIQLTPLEPNPDVQTIFIPREIAQIVDSQDPARLAVLIRQNLYDESHVTCQTRLQQEFIKSFYCGRNIGLGEAARLVIDRLGKQGVGDAVDP